MKSASFARFGGALGVSRVADGQCCSRVCPRWFYSSFYIGNGVLKSIVETWFCFQVYFFSLAVGSQLQNLSDLPHQALVLAQTDMQPSHLLGAGPLLPQLPPRRLPGAPFSVAFAGRQLTPGAAAGKRSMWAWRALLLLLCRAVETGTTIDIEGDDAPNPDPKSLKKRMAGLH